MNGRELDRQNEVNCKRVGCHYKTRRYDGFCSDRCKLSASTWIDADRGRRVVDGATAPTSSLPDSYATSLDAPASPLATSQVER